MYDSWSFDANCCSAVGRRARQSDVKLRTRSLKRISMSRYRSIIFWTRRAALFFSAGGLFAAGCAAPDAPDAHPASESSQTKPMVRLFSPPTQGGAELWAANCNRCHNAPAPTAFSAAEWDLILQHMRMRANLTGPEARTVADFLKAGS